MVNRIFLPNSLDSDAYGMTIDLTYLDNMAKTWMHVRLLTKLYGDTFCAALLEKRRMDGAG
jgi:hypothetical protein